MLPYGSSLVGHECDYLLKQTLRKMCLGVHVQGVFALGCLRQEADVQVSPCLWVLSVSGDLLHSHIHTPHSIV